MNEMCGDVVARGVRDTVLVLQVGTTSSHIFLSLAKPGLAVDPKDYEDAYSPVNPNGT